MKADLRISIKDYSKNKNLKIRLGRILEIKRREGQKEDRG
jgi:hypothetical protein